MAELGHPNKPQLFRHASGQWAKKIKGKVVYFGTDQAAALERYAAYRDRLESGLPFVRLRRRRQSNARPSPDFPLFHHSTGQWAKKIKGKIHYFGTDANAALNKYLEERDDLQAGRDPRRQSEGQTLREIVNAFLTAKRNQVSAAELNHRTFNDYHNACENLLAFFGKERNIPDLRPEDFGRYRAKLAETRKAVALGNSIIRVRCVFTWAFENEKIDKPVRYGTLFTCPSKKVKRRAKREGGSRMLEADEIRKLIETAKAPVKAMILLGINAGLGQSDIAALPKSALNLENGWLDFPRPKTETDRRCPLWPETVKAIREALAVRPKPKEPADAGLVFITQRGAPWVRCKVHPPTEDHPGGRTVFIDCVAQEFVKLLDKLGIDRRGSFYNLRHVHRTVSDAANEAPACNLIMGHTDGTMAGEYRERIDDDRLLAVVNVVRAWLWPVAKKRRRP